MGDEPSREGQIFGIAANTVISFSHNLQLSRKATGRIQAAVETLRATGHLPDGITERAKAISREAGVSMRTLYKEENQDLWRSGCRSVISCGVTASEDFPGQTEDVSEIPKVNDDGELPTSDKLMKGASAEISPVSNPFQIATPTEKGSICNESLRNFGDWQHPIPPI